MANKNEILVEVESVCVGCAGKGLVVRGHVTKKGKKCKTCEGTGQVTIWRKEEKN